MKIEVYQRNTNNIPKKLNTAENVNMLVLVPYAFHNFRTQKSFI